MKLSKFKSVFVKIILLFFAISCFSNPPLQSKESEFDEHAYKIWKDKIETCIKEIETHLSEYTGYFDRIKQQQQYLEKTYPLEQPFPYEFDLKTIENNIEKWRIRQQEIASFLHKREVHQAMEICKTNNIHQLQQELSIKKLEEKFRGVHQKRLALYHLTQGKKYFAKNSFFYAKEYFQKALKQNSELEEAKQELQKIIIEEKKQTKNQNLQVEVSCPGLVFYGKRFRVTVEIKNIGTETLNDIVVFANGPLQSIIVSAEEGDISENFATWKEESLSAGQSKVCNIVMILKTSGRNCLDIAINTVEGIRKQAQCCIGCPCGPIILLEVIDTNDPLVANEETTYIIEFTNQSTAADYNVKIEVVFPIEMSPISTNGDTHGAINGKRVTFVPYPLLFPKERIKWEIRAKARQPGDARIKVYMTSEMLKTPVVEEESTHVY